MDGCDLFIGKCLLSNLGLFEYILLFAGEGLLFGLIFGDASRDVFDLSNFIFGGLELYEITSKAWSKEDIIIKNCEFCKRKISPVDNAFFGGTSWVCSDLIIDRNSSDEIILVERE